MLTLVTTLTFVVAAPATSRDDKIDRTRQAVHQCTDRLGLERFPIADQNVRGERYRVWVLELWRARRQAVCGVLRQLQAALPFDEIQAAREWARSSGPECVSAHEGGVTTNTGNGYYGRWQADTSFQLAYGAEFYRRWGVASNWPRWAQDVMAYRGWRSRGWGPWPATSAMCGVS